MAARLVDGVKYIALMNDNDLKFKSLNDCVYYTLRDIFWNSEEYYYIKANDLNALLIKEKTDISIVYTNVLDDLNYIKQIYGFLNSLDKTSICFIEEPFHQEEKYIEYNIWYKQLEVLIKNLEKLILEKI